MAAKLWPATAAVPWPITTTRRIDPSRNRSATAAGMVRSPSSAWSRPSRSRMRPRSVLRKLAGASVISFSRKCGAVPRSMSRVVISATFTSASVRSSSVPS